MRTRTSVAVLLVAGLATACSGGSSERRDAAGSGADGSPVPSALAPTALIPTDALPSAAVTRSPAATASPSPRPTLTATARATASTATPASTAPLPRTTAAPRTTSTAAPRATARPTPSPTRASPTPSPTRSSPAPPPPVGTARALRIVDFSFLPQNLTVASGTTVTATNEDGATHDWTSSARVWMSGDLRRGQAFSYVFRTPGRFDYLCTIHPDMTGSVTVT